MATAPQKVEGIILLSRSRLKSSNIQYLKILLTGKIAKKIFPEQMQLLAIVTITVYIILNCIVSIQRRSNWIFVSCGSYMSFWKNLFQYKHSAGNEKGFLVY
jgi:hypothetical protein